MWELQIVLDNGEDGDALAIEHTFDAHPDLTTMILLRNEAGRFFYELYGEEHSQCMISVNRIKPTHTVNHQFDQVK